MTSTTKPVGYSDIERASTLLRVAPRPVVVVRLPEPVVVPSMVNGRELAGWERERYAEAMQRERRRELVLFAGLIG